MTAEAPIRAHIPVYSPIEQFRDAIQQCGLTTPEQIVADDIIHRFSSNGKPGDDAGWYIYHDGEVPAGAFGCWRIGLNETWCAKIGRALNAPEIDAHKQKIEAMRRAREAETAQRHAEGQAKAKAIMNAAQAATGNHPYEKRKKLIACPGVLQGAWLQRHKENSLLIPMYDGIGSDFGTLWNVEAIFPEKDQALDRDKDFLFCARKAGLFFPIGQLDGAPVILIGEGYATVISCYMATGLPAVVAFDAGNIAAVVGVIRQRYPDARIIIMGDDDKWGMDAHGKPLPNTGRIKAEEAAKRYNCGAVFPVFKNTGTKPKDFNDLHRLEGLEAVKSQLMLFAEGDAWEKPILFDAVTGPTIPANILPSPFCDFAKALAEVTETPESMVTLIVLGVIALILSRKYRVAANTDHSEPLNLYIFIAMLSGNRKTAIFNACLEPVAAWEKNIRRELEPNIKKKLSERKTQEKIIEGKRLKAAKSESPTEQDTLTQEIAELEANLPIVPVAPQLFITDATPESLRNKVAEQDGILGVLSDEGGIVDVIAGLYTGGNANIDIILKGIDGGHLRVERKGESVSLNPFLTFVLAVQPAVLDTMAEKKSFAGRGLLERFLYCIPQTSLGYRTHDKLPMAEKIRKDYEAAINNLLNIPDELENGELVQQLIKTEPAARTEWKEFQTKIETRMRPNEILSNCTGWASKLPGFVLRIAANLYIARHHANISSVRKVDQEAMRSALLSGALLVKHGESAFQSMVCDQFTRQAGDLWKWIRGKGSNSISRSDITYGVKNRTTGKAETLDILLTELIRRHLLRERKGVTGGRPVTVYDINPLALEQDHD